MLQRIARLLALLTLCAGPAAAQQALAAAAAAPPPTQAQRLKLAQHAIGINMAFYEAQRAGNIPKDSVTLFPNIWQWKKPGYENVCSDFVATLSPADRAQVDFPNKAGYYEAGNAVLVTGPAAFALTQASIGALQHMPKLANLTPAASVPDSADCLTGDYASTPLATLLLRQLRYEAAVLANAIMVTRADNSDFKMLIGVADSSTYGDDGFPSWGTPPEYQQKCYIADLDHPAADIAGQAAAGLAMAAKALATHGNAADKANATTYGVKAARTYEYAKLMWRTHGADAICSRSAANSNCVGSGCTDREDDGDPVRSPCVLYLNEKPPNQYLFVAAAALYALTGDAYYRGDADSMWPTPEQFPELQTYLYNWNNVITQGVVILSISPDLPGAARSRDYYRKYLRTSITHWAQCSNEGAAIFGDYKFCERTPDGSAYPLAMPWGNLGTIMNGMCAAGTYHDLGFDAADSPIRQASACSMQRQLGYIFNHKCTDDEDSSCATPNAEGFSYMVGIGNHYPTMLHSRDAAFPNFYSTSEPDPFPLCGALVSGPYAQTSEEDGPVDTGTDMYTNNRRMWRESEPAIDYTSSLVCTLMAYATMPDSLFQGCTARSPFTGRPVAP
eukprot:jgi/Ulvmu1/10075/UM006_0022.1